MKRTKTGFSLIEILVVVALFALISIVVSQSTITTLRGSKRADSTSTVRGNLNYALGVAERQLRSARAITSTCTSTGTSSTSITFLDENEKSSTLSCYVGSTSGYLLLNSGVLTSQTDVQLTTCEFVCTQNAGSPANISINLTGKSKGTSALETAEISASTNVSLRTF